MAVNYVVHAEVVDIRIDQPKKADVFVVDTNVWFWIAYTRAIPTPHQRRNYPVYLKNALTTHAVVMRFALSQAELFHLIEKTEYEIFRLGNPGIKPKEFRHNLPLERTRVATECRVAWATVKTFASPLDALVTDLTTNAALGRYQTQSLDGYDLFLLEMMHDAGLRQILTDDGDFCTVPGIQVFTANQNVINAAKVQGKLVIR